jgi:peptide/nickel transport system permease protein
LRYRYAFFQAQPFPRGESTMLAFILRRLWQMLPTMLGVVLLVFVLFNWVGGDPAYILAGKMSDAEAIANIRRQLGVDQPWHVQLWIFIKQIVTFDFGNSWATGEPVSHIMATRLGPSLTVLVPMTILETVLGIGLALAVAFVRGSLTDRAVMIACTVGMSVSILVYIIVFQYGLAYKLGLFPVQGWGASLGENLLRYAMLPILIGLAVSIAPTLRLYRSFVLDEVGQDYVRTARAKGLPERRIMWVHVLRNASIPIITHVMANLPALLIGAFLLERFFGIPGIGREVILAVERSDFPVIKAITVYVAAATMFFNLLTDLLYQAVDPRVQLK